MLTSRAWLALAVLGFAVWLAADAYAGPRLDVEAEDVSAEAGIADFSHTYGAAVADWDDDGWDDALLNKHYDSFPRLMLNEAGTFTDATDDAFAMLPTRRDYHGCAAADVDLNGELDLYCTVGGKHGGNGANRKELWLQEGGTFTEHAQEWGVRDEFGRGRQATFIDANADERPDLYVTNHQPRKDGKRGANRLFINEGGDAFRSAPEFRVNRQIGGGSVQAIDFDLDGFQDLFLCGQSGVRIFRNVNGRRFHPVTRVARANGLCGHAALATMNPDARPDLVVLHKGYLRVILQGSKGRLQRKPVFRERVKRALTFALGDMNGDEVPDIYVVRRGEFDPERPRERQSDVRDVMLASTKRRPSFARVPVPSSRRGIGESVTAIDHDANGLSDFIVANGRFKTIGPTRLVAFYPREP